ncbi:hypothetical protein IFM89_026529 [Coptis chinensis]|uniref:Uncharacterized protein n=1 Tax=Coptis chinensis TaxID=261450 RepID=A0A835MJ92_9MAGN|nr:hypothetical protein IFM89_026529 [Coptis chinensis]
MDIMAFQVPTIPKASRSARVNTPTILLETYCKREKVLLFLVMYPRKVIAREGKYSASSNVSYGRVQPTIVKDTIKKELLDEEKPLKLEPRGSRKLDESVFASEFGLQGSNKDRVRIMVFASRFGVCEKRKRNGKVTKNKEMFYRCL